MLVGTASFTGVVGHVENVLSGCVEEWGDSEEDKNAEALKVGKVGTWAGDGLQQRPNQETRVGDGCCEKEINLKGLRDV